MGVSANYKPDDETLNLIRTRLNAMNAGQDPNLAMMNQDSDWTAGPGPSPAPNASVMPPAQDTWTAIAQSMAANKPSPTPGGQAEVVYPGNGITGPTLKVPTHRTTTTGGGATIKNELQKPVAADASTATQDRGLADYLQAMSTSYQADQDAIKNQEGNATAFFNRPQQTNYLPLMSLIDRMSYDPLSPNKPTSNLAEQYMKSGYMPMSPDQRAELQMKIMNELSSQRGKLAGLDPKYLALMLNRGGGQQTTTTTAPKVTTTDDNKIVTPPVGSAATIGNGNERDARNQVDKISTKLEDSKASLNNLDQALAKNDYQTTGAILGQVIRSIGGETRVPDAAVVRSLPDNYEKSLAGLESFLSKANTAELPPGFNDNLRALVRQTEQAMSERFKGQADAAANGFKKSKFSKGVDVDGIFKPLYDSLGEMKARGQVEVSPQTARPTRAQFPAGPTGDQAYGDALTQFIQTHKGKK